MKQDERRDDEHELSEEEGRPEPAATDEETARAAREPMEEEPTTDAEASEADAVEQSKPWR